MKTRTKMNFKILILYILLLFSCKSQVNVAEKVKNCSSGVYYDYAYGDPRYFNTVSDTCLIISIEEDSPELKDLILNKKLTYLDFNNVCQFSHYTYVTNDEPWGLDYEIHVPSCLHFIPIRYFAAFYVDSVKSVSESNIYYLSTYNGPNFGKPNFWTLTIESDSFKVEHISSHI